MDIFNPDVEIEDYNAMIDWRNVFDQPLNNKERTDDNIQKIANWRGDDYMTGCLLDYHSFKDHYKVMIIDLSKQQAFDADPNAIQHINFTRKLKWLQKPIMFSQK